MPSGPHQPTFPTATPTNPSPQILHPATIPLSVPRLAIPAPAEPTIKVSKASPVILKAQNSMLSLNLLCSKTAVPKTLQLPILVFSSTTFLLLLILLVSKPNTSSTYPTPSPQPLPPESPARAKSTTFPQHNSSSSPATPEPEEVREQVPQASIATSTFLIFPPLPTLLDLLRMMIRRDQSLQEVVFCRM